MHFEDWWNGSKYMQVVFASPNTKQAAQDGCREGFNARQPEIDSLVKQADANYAEKVNLAIEIEQLKESNAALLVRIQDFDYCIRKIATELGGVCCGGVDVDQSNPHSTTAVLVGAIRELRAQAAIKFLRGENQRLFHPNDAAG